MNDNDRCQCIHGCKRGITIAKEKLCWACAHSWWLLEDPDHGPKENEDD